MAAPPPPPTTVAATLVRVSLQGSDIAPAFGIRPYQDGDSVAGQVTLAFCGATFPSEGRRRARHQIGVVDGGGTFIGLSTEAIRYDSTAGAQQALAEIAAAKAHCPSGFVPGGVQGEPPLKYAFGAPPDAGWPAVRLVTRIALAVTVTDQQGNQYHSLEIFQERGALLVGLYIDLPMKPGLLAPSIGGIEGLARETGRRLLSLPGANTL